MDNINVCLACDDNYSKYAGVVIASILDNAKSDDNICVYVLDGGITQENKDKINSLKSIKDCKINFVGINNSMFDDYAKVSTNKYISLATFYRLKLSELLPNVDRVIYLDCDVVVNKSLKDLFNSDLDGLAIGGVSDIDKRKVRKNPDYVNAGMLVMDLKTIREQNIESQFLEWTKQNINTIKLGDQEIINEVLKGKIKLLNKRWNVQSSNFVNRSSYTHHPYIIHFVSKRKPWHFGSFSYHKDYYFKYLELTPWKIPAGEKDYWGRQNKIASFFGYIKYRPLFLFRPRFWVALYNTYVKNDD